MIGTTQRALSLRIVTAVATFAAPAMLLAASATLAACGKDPPQPREVRGSLAVDGNPVTLKGCRAGVGEWAFLDVITSQGTLHFEGATLYWRTDDAAPGRGHPLACTKLDRHWGARRRPDNSWSWTGFLDLQCSAETRTFAGRIDVDCGAEQRAKP